MLRGLEGGTVIKTTYPYNVIVIVTTIPELVAFHLADCSSSSKAELLNVQTTLINYSTADALLGLKPPQNLSKHKIDMYEQLPNFLPTFLRSFIGAHRLSVLEPSRVKDT